MVLEALAAEFRLLAERDADHLKAACHLLASRRFARYLTTDASGRPRLDPAKVKGGATRRQIRGHHQRRQPHG